MVSWYFVLSNKCHILIIINYNRVVEIVSSFQNATDYWNFWHAVSLSHTMYDNVRERSAEKSIIIVTRFLHLGRAKRIWYLSPMRAAKVQASLRIRAVSPEPSLLAHTSSESRGTFRQKARSLAPLNGWACAVKICRDGMLEDTNSLDGAHIGINVIKLTSENAISRVICRLLTERQIIFLPIFSPFVIKCATNFKPEAHRPQWLT